jgi:hypothetical protein
MSAGSSAGRGRFGEEYGLPGQRRGFRDKQDSSQCLTLWWNNFH